MVVQSKRGEGVNTPHHETVSAVITCIYPSRVSRPLNAANRNTTTAFSTLIYILCHSSFFVRSLLAVAVKHERKGVTWHVIGKAIPT